VGRRRQPEIRDRLLDTCTEFVLAHGLPDRLRPLADAAGVSPRMLLYHFTSKDELLRAVLRHARSRQHRDFGELLAPRPGEPYLVTLRRAWPAMTSPRGRGYLDLFGRLREDTQQQLWPGFRLQATSDWLTPLGEGMGTLGRPELATVVLAAIRGLIMDLEATGDSARVDQAFADFVGVLETSTALH